MIKQRLEVAGYFKMIAIRPDGTERIVADWFPNMIVNQGLDIQMGSIAAGTNMLGACRVGTGNTAPAPTDTTLVAQVAITTTIQAQTFGSVTSSPWYGWKRTTFRFAIGAAAGNLAEVGISTSSAGNPLVSRALIVDGGGSPTTITILSDEILDVIYEYRVYPLQADAAFNVTISAVNYSCVARTAFVGSDNVFARNVGLAFTFGTDQFSNSNRYSASNGALGPVTGSPGGTVETNGIDPVTNGPYTPGTFTRNVVITWDLDRGNLAGGITAILSPMSLGWYQISFSPAIAKDNTKTLQLTLTYTIARRVI